MQQSQQMFIHVDEQMYYDSEKDKYETKIVYSASTADMTEYGWVMLPEPQTFTFEVPDSFDFKAGKAKAVQVEMQIVRAEFQKKITELQSVYNSLLAIEG